MEFKKASQLLLLMFTKQYFLPDKPFSSKIFNFFQGKLSHLLNIMYKFIIFKDFFKLVGHKL